jgi:glycerol-3-phosphate O-acyltransferase
MSEFISRLEQNAREGLIPEKFKHLLEIFYSTYKQVMELHGMPFETCEHLFLIYLDLVREQCRTPFSFQPYHEQVRTPFDHYTFGLSFLKPLVDNAASSAHGLDRVKKIDAYIRNGENVVLLANHQTEADPQAISILLEKNFPDLVTKMIFVAGERVITDPLAIPFSMGRNLLCIYSKRYIDNPPELKEKKQHHNHRTMQLMSELLAEGGKCIYVAPSGGRDRPNSAGIVEVAPFDPQSIEMFYLMAKKSGRSTHFFPLALLTQNLLPPPETIQVELGEARIAKRGAIHLAFGPEIDMEHFPGSDATSKQERRKVRGEYIWNLVKEEYQALKELR